MCVCVCVCEREREREIDEISKEKGCGSTEGSSEEKAVAVSAKQVPHSARHIQREGASVHRENPTHTHTHRPHQIRHDTVIHTVLN